MGMTARQTRGDYGEAIVVRLSCPRCKRAKTLKRLPTNFKCADIMCDFCGYLAQGKCRQHDDIEVLLRKWMGAAWKPQAERMEAGMYFPLFIVIVPRQGSNASVWYLPAD